MIGKHYCRQVAELLSQRLDEPLGRLDSLRLWVHLKLCPDCVHADQQFQSVRSLSAGFLAGELDLEGEPPPPSRDDQPTTDRRETG